MSVESSSQKMGILGKSYPSVAPLRAQAAAPVKTKAAPPPPPPPPVAKSSAAPPPPPPPVMNPQASASPKSVPPVQPPSPPPPAVPRKDFSPEQMAIPTPAVAPPPKPAAPVTAMAVPPPPKPIAPPLPIVPRVATPMQPATVAPPPVIATPKPIQAAMPSSSMANPYPYLQKPKPTVPPRPQPIAPPSYPTMPTPPVAPPAMQPQPTYPSPSSLSAQQQLAAILAKGKLAAQKRDPLYKGESAAPQSFQSPSLSSLVAIPAAIERKLNQKFIPEPTVQAAPSAPRSIGARELPHMKEEKLMTNMVLVPAGTEIEGMLRTSLPVTIYGKVFGKIQSSSKVVIEKDGDVQADIECTELDIFGSVDGEIQATQEIRLHKSGRLVGIVKTPNLKTESGSFFQGMVQMDEAA